MARYPLPPAEPVVLETLAEIAKGGMGSVEMASARGGRIDGRVVAVKRLNEEVAEDPTFVNMFLDEAWMTSAIRSPHVIRAEAWGKDARGMFLAVELVQGVSLSRLIKESKANEEPFAERTVANLGSQICAGLDAAHNLRGPDGAPLGLVHRDLTPGNILVSFDGVVKIADFGIAQAEERLTQTRTGMMKGKPAYMAPEQARGGRVDARADIFSLGVMLFELLAGVRPWKGRSAFDVLMEVATKPPPPLESIRRGVNPMFSEIVARCLQKRPEDRFQQATDIKVLLDRWRAEKGFDRDDQASMSKFVCRNTPRQQAWFRDALQGVANLEAPTFKDLEQKIDLARSNAGGASPSSELSSQRLPAPRPAAGLPAQASLPSPASGVPAQGAGYPSPTGVPAQGFPSRPSGAANLQSTSLMATRIASDPSLPLMPGGTAPMRQSPMPRHPSGTVPIPPSHATPAAGHQPGTLPLPPRGPTALQQGPLIAPTVPEPMEVPPVSGPITSVAGVPRKSTGLLIVLAAMLVVLGAGAAVAWYFRGVLMPTLAPPAEAPPEQQVPSPSTEEGSTYGGQDAPSSGGDGSSGGEGAAAP